MERGQHRRQHLRSGREFICFLNHSERAVLADKRIYVILDNYAAHKKDKVQQWLARHPHWTFHCTRTSCS
ncbi:transposase [Sphingobium sp. TKS]|nr:transposase [Sphingobium sp. TKS]